MQTRYITQQHIKTKIEKHNPGNFSSMRTYNIFKGRTYMRNAYIEFTGYKYENTKGLVIGADKYYLARQKFHGDKTVIAEISYVELTLAQTNAILENYKDLQQSVKAEKVKLNEEVYHDYTVSEDLFISFRKISGSSSYNYIDLWINNEKFTVSTAKIMSKLQKFIEY
jgi:hypothetical protein